MRAWWLLGVFGCNQIFGLEPTELEIEMPDARPLGCAAPSLSFSPLIEQAIIQDCKDYTIVGDTAIAVCAQIAPSMFESIAQGAVDQPLKAATIAPQIGDARFQSPRLAPDGELFVLQVQQTGPRTISVYRSSGSTTWSWSYDFSFTIADRANSAIGTPSRRPARRIMVTDGTTVAEAEENPNDVWTKRASYTAADFGVTTIRGPVNLSPDGTRAVFAATMDNGRGVRHAQRATLGERFVGSYSLDVPFVPDPFLLEDCSRLYFTGVGSVFYARQR